MSRSIWFPGEYGQELFASIHLNSKYIWHTLCNSHTHTNTHTHIKNAGAIFPLIGPYSSKAVLSDVCYKSFKLVQSHTYICNFVLQPCGVTSKSRVQERSFPTFLSESQVLQRSLHYSVQEVSLTLQFNQHHACWLAQCLLQLYVRIPHRIDL